MEPFLPAITESEAGTHQYRVSYSIIYRPRKLKVDLTLLLVVGGVIRRVGEQLRLL